jgi:DNA-binding beta-propeller fold protein YncE
MRRRAVAIGLCLAALFVGGAAPAQAERALITNYAVETEKVPGGLEGACGVALTGGKIYVSDYYHHAIAVFNGAGNYLTRIPGNPLDGPCQLATSAGGALYANDWHESVSRVLPSALGFDSAESTGVAVDQASGNVYVNDRTYVAVYEPSGAPVLGEGGQPLRLGLGTLVDAYGIAVDAGRVYVPDAADDTVKVYEPASDPTNPVAVVDGAATPQGRFISLVDAAVAIDPTNGHLVVLDNLQPGFEFPEAAIEEFDSSGEFLGQVAQKVIHGEPGGLAFGGSTLYVTSGNSGGASVLQFGAYTSLAPLAARSPVAASALAATAGGTDVSPDPQGATRALRLSAVGITRDGGATIAVVVPAAGTLRAEGKGLLSLRRRTGAGRRVLRLHLSRGGRRALARAGTLKVRVRIAFAPDAGAALRASKTLIVGGTDGGKAR